jgi:hypothetical protein
LKYFIPLLGVFFFLCGSYYLKMNGTVHQPKKLSVIENSVAEFPASLILVNVGNSEITNEDLEFEFKLHAKGIEKTDELTPIPDLGDHTENELSPLKSRLVSFMIERKLLYNFVQEDKKFDYENPGRFVSCLNDWLEAVEKSDEFKNKFDQQRLKTRLCERSIVQQYMEENIFNDITIAEGEIVEYYKNNLKKFRHPAKVEIRHILVASERDAKRVRSKLRRKNFSQMAREKSISPEASKGGKLGPFAKSEMPQVFSSAFNMRRGRVSNIIKSKYGYHFMMVEKKYKAVDQSLLEATDKIIEALTERKRSEIYQKWVESAISSIPIKSPKPLW